jgi:hypothetical protein
VWRCGFKMAARDALGIVKVGVESFLQNFYAAKTTKKNTYTAASGNDVRLSVNVNDFHIGYIVDAPFFDKALVDPDQESIDAKIQIMADFEDYNQRILKESGSRRYSGLHSYSHIYGDMQIAFELAKDADVPVGFVTSLDIIGHDGIEERRKIKELENEWEKALIAIPPDYNRMKNLSYELKSERDKARAETEQYLVSSLGKTAIKGLSREKIKRDIVMATDIMLDVTRFPDKYPYPISMARQYKKKSGGEGLLRVGTRSFVRTADRINNLREFEPFPNLSELADIFDSCDTSDVYTVGDELKERYGTIRRNAMAMPPAIMVVTAVRSVFPLHFLNETLNTNAEHLSKAQGRILEQFRLLEYGKKKMIKATLDLLDSAQRTYESNKSLTPNLRDDVSREIDYKKGGSYFYEMTWEGPAGRWIIYDGVGREFIEKLDEHSRGMVSVYRDARDISTLVPMFGKFHEKKKKDDMGRPILIDDPDIKFDPKIHEHFTLGDVDKTLDYFFSGDKYGEEVATQRYMQEMRYGSKGHSRKFLGFF